MRKIVCFFLCLGLVACSKSGEAVEMTDPPKQQQSQAAAQKAPAKSASAPFKRYRAQIINTFPHDTDAFTQGLFFHDGALYEGTGQRGQSALRQLELETGKVIKSKKLEDRFFGEGIVLWGDKIISLTWQAGTGLVHSLDGFEELARFYYDGEGWGLTASPTELIMSDGSSFLRFLDPTTFEETSRISVTAGGDKVTRINELEWVNGLVFANLWQSNFIAQIDPTTGKVVGVIDLSGLLKPEDITAKTDVLNGIAYDKETNRLFVTGKNWPKLFEIKLIEVN